MNKDTRLICWLLTLLFILSLPFLVPSPAMLDAERNRLYYESDTGDLWSFNIYNTFLDFLIPKAAAEESSFIPLPMDLSGGRLPQYEAFTPDGYIDESISLQLETIAENGKVWRIAHVQITDPSQLRSGLAGNPGSSRVALISSMAKKNNAVIAINANYLTNDPNKTSFEYRMGERIRNKLNKAKDLLITDENADFHVFIKSEQAEVQAFLDEGHQIINAFTFGPALVKNGVLLELDNNYSYNPHGKEPRMAIGQIGPLQYVIVLAEGRLEDAKGATHEELAVFMFQLGCLQAFNFDGGNSATMVYNDSYYQEKTLSNERAQSDFFYFATLIDALEK